MTSKSNDQSGNDTLDHLRRQAVKVDALERKIEELELQRQSLETSTVQLEAQLEEYRQIREEWDWIFENSLDMLVIHDRKMRPLRVSPSVVRVIGFTQEEFISIDIQDMIHPDDLERAVENIKAIEKGADTVNFEMRCRHKDGGWRWLSWTTPGLQCGAQRYDRTYSLVRDVTVSKMTEQQLLYRAQHDPLTGLANRSTFDQALEAALARTSRTGRQVSLLAIDLDGFKSVNDTHGHLMGNAVLCAVASRLREAQRKGDVVARLGGDEFVILMEDADRQALEAVATRVLSSVCEPVETEQLSVTVGCSIGISSCGGGDASATGLFEQADRALYEAKRNGKRTFRYFER